MEEGGGKRETYGKVLGEAFDALALAGLLAVELLRVELLVQPEGLDFAVEPGKLGLWRRGEVEPARTSGCVLHLVDANGGARRDVLGLLWGSL